MSCTCQNMMLCSTMFCPLRPCRTIHWAKCTDFHNHTYFWKGMDIWDCTADDISNKNETCLNMWYHVSTLGKVMKDGTGLKVHNSIVILTFGNVWKINAVWNEQMIFPNFQNVTKDSYSMPHINTQKIIIRYATYRSWHTKCMTL